MLEYLVTSKVRRRLLLLLWEEQCRGTAGELAERAGVAFGAAHGELKAMYRAQLVTSTFVDGKELYAANVNHPQADALRELVRAEPVMPMPDDEDDSLRRALVFVGAPLRGVKAQAVSGPEVMTTLARGALLARRDAVVARAMPLCFWRSRELLDIRALSAAAPRAEDKHAVAFFVELAGVLGEDRRLVGLAESLRDRRLSSLREFFVMPASRRAHRSFPLAERWGFQMNMDLSSFQSLFEKFVR